jgi:hypothetical protein
MFVARERPLLVVEDRLLALRLSLNTPVLSTAELPLGPARAAITAFAEGSERRFAVIVRSLRNGTAVTYELDGEDASDDADGWTVALDAALSFGESMGFVFDDEMLVDRRGETLRRGVVRLHELLAPPGIAEEPGEGEPQIGSAIELAEILLEDAVEIVEPGAPAAPSPLAVVDAPAAAVAAPPVALSKFRGAAPAQAAPTLAAAAAAPVEREAPAPARGPATLGRVRPVRVRADSDAPPPADPLLRLLADF